MKRLVFYIFLAGFSFSVYAQKAQDIIDRAATAYEKANGMKADFDIHIRSDKQQISESFEGKIDMNKEKFVLTTPDMIVWFDGKTQWTYLIKNKEVNITEPSGDELLKINPILLLSAYGKSYNASLRGESTSSGGKAAYDIILTSKNKKKAETIELQIEKNTYLPARITVSSDNDFRTTISIRHIQTDIKHSVGVFVFKQNDYPDVDIIDLR